MEEYATELLRESLHKDGFLTELIYEDKTKNRRCKLIIYKRADEKN